MGLYEGLCCLKNNIFLLHLSSTVPHVVKNTNYLFSQMKGQKPLSFRNDQISSNTPSGIIDQPNQRTYLSI
jgi:hypothetical protein